jgi:hypothetical protein
MPPYPNDPLKPLVTLKNGVPVEDLNGFRVVVGLEFMLFPLKKPFILFFILFILSLLLSNFFTPIMLKVSARRLVLIAKSRGLSQANEGERLISSNHGLRIRTWIIL